MRLRHIFAAGMIAGLVGASASTVRAAEPIVLKFAFNGPLSGTPAQKGALPWAAKIKAATDEAVDINVVLGISTYANVHDRILNGVADFGFGTFGNIKLSKAERDRLRQVLAPITREWVARVPNGEKILAAFTEEVARIRKP